MGGPVVIHEYLRKARETSIEGLTWLDRLPDLIEEACRGWKVEVVGKPYDGGVCGWVAPVRRWPPRSAGRQVVVHGDLNPGNILAASRAPFLAIDPKPMVGDPAYDPWSLVAQLDWPYRLAEAERVVIARIRWLAERLDVTAERIAGWGIARDFQGGLWAASEGNPALGAKWIRSATIIAPMLS